MDRGGVRHKALWIGLALLALAGCATPSTPPPATPVPDGVGFPGVPSPAAEPGPDFRYTYVVPTSPSLQPLYRRVLGRDLLRRLPEVRWLDGLLILPQPIAYVMTECGQPDAVYRPDTREVVLCYEVLQVLHEKGRQLAADRDLAGTAATELAEHYVLANLRFIASHETGHALIDLLDLPVTGRQEDAVDQFATALMQTIAAEDESPADVADNLRLAAHWFLSRADGGFSLDAYADTHSLDLQRYFNLQCLLYGSDPERFAGIVAGGDLPESRARYCPAEARRATSAWMRLLLPHLAPRYRMTEAQAEAWLEQRRRARQQATAPEGATDPAGTDPDPARAITPEPRPR